MATKLGLDPDLLERAFRLRGERTKTAAVARALEEFVARREQRRVAEQFGELEWDRSFDHEVERSRTYGVCSSTPAPRRSLCGAMAS